MIDSNDPIICETCNGTGKIDNWLGGDPSIHDEYSDCPDCDGSGEIED